MATKKRSVPLPDSGIDWSSPVGEFQPSNPAANDAATADQPSSALRRAADYIPTLVKGAISVPEAAVGMADLVTGGRVGKFLENEGGAIGFRPKEARAALDEFYSPEQKAAFQEVQNADGFIGTGMAALRNPSVIGQAVAESLPLMGAGGVVARGVGAVVPRMSGAMLGAVGEGVTGAGSAAEQIRQETPDGLLTGKQAALAATSGLADTVFGALGGKIAQRMGIADVDTMLAGKGSPTTTKSFVKSVLEGAVSEGLLEELPQSIAEQVAQNAALDKPLSEGVDQQAVLGLLTGGIMGAGANAAHSLFPAAHPADEIRATKLPESGPLTKGLNAAIETHADAVESATAEAATQTRRQQTAPIVEQLRQLPPEQQDEALQMMSVADNMQAPGPVRRRAQNRLDYLFSNVAPQGAAGAAQATGEVPQDAVAPVAPTVEVPNEPAAQPAEQSDAIAQREADRPVPAVTPRQEGDILTNSGVPFRNMTAAMRALGRAGEGYELAPVEGGLVVRKSAAPQPEQMQHAPAEESVPPVVDAAQVPVQDVTASSGEATQTPDPVATSPTQAADVAGEPIDKEWTAFTPESGTKGIPRAELPQIKAAHRGAMVNFLNARGITHETVEIPAGELKPTQAEFSPAKVQQAKDFTDTDRSILVSSDGHVLDGHHQWLAKLDNNEPVKAIRLNAPIADLVSTVREFPSAGQADGATTAQPTGTLQEQWQDAVKRGDTEAASKINDQIVAEKQDRKATEAAPADDTNQTSGPRAEAQAAADQAPAPARSDAAAPASVPTAGAATATEAAGVAKTPAPKKRSAPSAKAAAAREAKRADYFTPGNVVHGYGGQMDRVISYTPGTDEKMWSVKVQHVVKQGDNYVVAKERGREVEERQHSTEPSEKELKTGPVSREPAKPSAHESLVSESDQANHEATPEQATERPAAQAKPAVAPVEALSAESESQATETTVDEPATAAPQAPLESSKEADVSVTDAVPPVVASETVEGAALATKPDGRIHDFGEKLDGARKDYAATLKDAESVDVAAEPLSKSWPEPDYQKLLDGGADPFVVAFIHAARDEVPTKPQKGWKLKGWVTSVQALRTAAAKLMDGSVSKAKVQDLLGSGSFDAVRRNVGSRAELYELVGHQHSLKGVTFSEHHYTLYRGGQNVTKWVVEQKAKATLFSNWPRELAVADTKAEMLAQFKDKIGSLDLGKKAKGQSSQFVIYRKRGQTGAWVGKKIGREYIDLHQAEDVTKARAYMAEHASDLEAKLAKYRDTPYERRDENQPRVGDDHRNGAPVTPDVFMQTFGFRGVQFGNYVEQDRRQSDLNEAFDGLMDLAAVLGVPPRALSLNGTLGLAFGARGKGGKRAPAAHFEPGNIVINLTKGGGPGSLAHEWWHGLDNYFARQAGGTSGLITGGAPMDRLRPQLQGAYKSVRIATQAPTLRKRAAELDKRRSKPYWNTPEELSARAFESYVIAKLQDQGAANDYLANVVDEKVWNLNESARSALFGEDSVESYPYPGQAELPAVRAAFDDFFKTVETRTEDNGNVAMFSRAASYVDAVDSVLDGTTPESDSVRVSDSLPVLEALGLPSLPVATTGDRLAKMHYDHGLTRSDLKALPELLANPAMVFDSATKPGSKVLVLDLWRRGSPVIAAIHPNVQLKRVDVNLLAIAYPKDRPEQLGTWFREKLLRYADKDKTRAWATNGGVQFPWLVQLQRGSGSSLIGPGDVGKPALSRTEPVDSRSAARRLEDITQLAEQITSRWANAPEVVVVEDMSDPRVPESIRAEDTRQQSQGATGAPEGVYYKGKVYLVASELRGDADVVRVLFHEAIGHAGLRGTFGKELGAILDRLAVLNQGKVRNKAKQYGLNYEKTSDRRAAAEEVLAEMAQTRPEIGWVKRAIAAIRTFLRDHVPGFSRMQMTDDEIVRSFIVPARAWVERGGKAPAANSTPAFQRVWHGTPHRGIEKFSTDKIGTGEGAQAYGWGLYFASKKEIAEHYRKGLSYREIVREFRSEMPDDADFSDALDAAGTMSPERGRVVRALAADDWLGFDYPAQAIAAAFKDLDNYDPSPELRSAVNAARGQLYQAEIPEDSDMLLWDKPLSEQPAGVRDALERAHPELFVDAWTERGVALPKDLQDTANADPERAQRVGFQRSNPSVTTTGEQFYRNLAAEGYGDNSFRNGGSKAASERLAGLGIKGIKYLDGTSRADGDGSYNYVIFSGDDTEVVATMFSRSPSEVLRGINQESIRNAFLDATTSHDNVGLWAKTVGTQYDKAQRHPQTFGRVFNAVQDYIKDISSFANAAADQAPHILPKLDNLSDLKPEFLKGSGDRNATKDDLNAVGSVIFQGTLDKQLLDRPALLAKGLTEKQADLYEEFRAAVNQSLEDVAKTEIVRLAGTAGAPLASQALAAPTAREAADILAERLRQQGLAEDADGLYGKVDTVEKLKAEGYAPLMRFGKHTVHIQRGGETLFFGMYESRTEANAMARKLRGDAEFAGLPVEQGVMSQEAYKLFNGLSIDSLELFANEIGGQDNQVYQDFLKLTKNNRSALKRLIHRNGTAGFSTNTERVLASFVTSNARLASGNLHLGRAKAAANDIPKELGDLKDEAVRLVDYVQNPQEEAQAVRGLLFTTFIGGSVASALVNMTQPFVMTLPHLSQYGGLAKAGARMVAALKIVASGKAHGELGQALRRAEADGIVSPQEIHHLQAATTDSLGNNPYLKKAAFIWGSMFSLAEQFNRRLSFVAAYQTALDNKMADPFAFAEKAVIETQGLYNKGNKANWARGPIGATAMTFKQFSTSYIEWITRMYQSGPEGKKAAVTALAILMLAGGAGGLPFADDVDDLIDTLAQALGYDFNSKRAKRKFISDTLGLGDTAAEVATRGLTALPGFPMDLSVRLGMGNLLPATGILLRSNTDRSRDLLEVAGAGGGLAKMALDAGEKALQGDPLGAAKAVVPVAIQNVAKALEMWNTGEYRNQKGAKVADVDAIDGAMKLVGFQPAEVARESAEVNAIQRTIQLVKNVESDLAGRMAQARVDGDIEAEQEARQELIDWNRKNPDSPIRIRPADIARRARELRASRADRLVKSAPKELRPAVQGALN